MLVRIVIEYNKMDPSDFTKNKPGKLIRAPQDYWTFVPHPLEPRIDLDLPLVQRLSAADRALSELAGMARMLPNPHLLIDPFLRREAVLSSRIEGTRATFSDLLFFEAAKLREREVPDVREVANYVQALEHGLSRLGEIPMCLRLIREMHAKLLAGVRGEHLTPGQFRRSQNWIGPPGCTLAQATYVPPPVEEMQAALDAFEKYLHAPSDLPPLIRYAQIHYQFEAIHPFLDGNGRIGRLLITLLMCCEGLLPQPILYLSAFFERYQDDYYRLLLQVSQQGAWNDWVSFFLQGIATQARDTIRCADELLALWQVYRSRALEARSSTLLLQLVDQLFISPALTNSAMVKKLAITPRSAQLNIDKLVKAGILEEATGRRRHRVYVAPEILAIIDQ